MFADARFRERYAMAAMLRRGATIAAGARAISAARAAHAAENVAASPLAIRFDDA